MDNDSTKVSDTLQRELAEYGIVRKKVMEKAAPKKNGDANFFGFRDHYTDTEFKFGSSIKAIQDDGMMVAMAAPENESFDMLVTTDFNKAISTASEPKLRAFIRNIVNRA